MAARAACGAEKEPFARGRVAAARRRVRGGRRGREAADIGDELPDLLIGQARERRHLAAGDADPDRVEQIAVVATVREGPGIERGTAVALSCRTVTRLAGLIVEKVARSGRIGAIRQRVSRRVGLLGERRNAQHHRYKRSPAVHGRQATTGR